MKVLVGPARAWASIAPPEPGASLEWSGTPSSINVAIGGSYNAAQHVVYDGEGVLTYSSVGTSLSGTGISLNASTGVLSVSGEASAGTVGGIQIRVTDGTLTADSPTFSAVKQSSVLALDFPATLNLTREYNDGSGLSVTVDFEEYVSYSGGGSLTYNWVGGRPSKYISLNSSTADNGYPGRMRIAANSPPLSFPSLTVQVTDGTHTETATFALNVSVPGYQILRFQEFLAEQVASRSGRVILGHHTLYDGAGTLTYSSIGSSLPAGASLNSSTGLITLSSVAVGTYTGLQFRITDGTNTVDTPMFSLEVVDEALIYPDTLSWVGAFRMPSGMALTDYMGRGMGVDPAGNSGAGSLFVPSHDQYTRWGEITIPTPTASTSKSALARADQLQAIVDAYEGTIGEISPPSHQNGGILPWGSEVVLSAYQYYGTSQVKTHWIRPRNLSTTGSLVGPVESAGTTPPTWHVSGGTWPRRSFAGNMARVPTSKQSIFGGPAVSGQAGTTNIGEEANGPFAGVFDPDEIGVTNPLPYKGVVGYPLERALCTEMGGLSTTSRSVTWNQASVVRGIAIPSNKDATLFVGILSMGEYWYGEPTTDSWAADTNWGYDPFTGHSSKGPHAYPGRYAVWAYRNSDINAVRAGAKKHYEIFPYAIWTLDIPLYDKDVEGISLNDVSAAFDETTNRLYLCCHFLDGDYPVVHVLEVV